MRGLCPPWQNSWNSCSKFGHKIACRALADKPVSMLAWLEKHLLCSQPGHKGWSAVVCRQSGARTVAGMGGKQVPGEGGAPRAVVIPPLLQVNI